MCPQPPADHIAPPVIISGHNDYIFCGNFILTAYQFAEDVGYPIERIVTADAGAKKFKASYAFIKDVELNGTGFSSNASLFEYCGTNYFRNASISDNMTTFTFQCGPGKPFTPPQNYYGKVVAADLGLLRLGTKLYLPEMCAGNRLCTDREYNPFVTVRDEGNAIRGYRLDVFAGQGPGTGATNNTPALLWIAAHTYLGTTTTWDDRQGLGPTRVYQPIPRGWQDLFYRVLLCGQTTT
jgi:3D (Asp-Asp-Asp) domain-containing protein